MSFTTEMKGIPLSLFFIIRQLFPPKLLYVFDSCYIRTRSRHYSLMTIIIITIGTLSFETPFFLKEWNNVKVTAMYLYNNIRFTLFLFSQSKIDFQIGEENEISFHFLFLCLIAFNKVFWNCVWKRVFLYYERHSEIVRLPYSL